MTQLATNHDAVRALFGFPLPGSLATDRYSSEVWGGRQKKRALPLLVLEVGLGPVGRAGQGGEAGQSAR